VPRHRPPFAITSSILASTASILRLLGRFDGLHRPAPSPKLRRVATVRTVVATLAIEGEVVEPDRVTALLDGKRVGGAAHELRAAKNAIAAYARGSSLRPEREADFLAAHGILMKGLLPDAGRFRRGNVGIMSGSRVAHFAPQPKRVPTLVADLLDFVGGDADTHPLVKSAVTHYEIEVIHPFSDGNGRMGRLWQHFVLLRFDRAFAHVPVETVVRERQLEYYAALAESDDAGDATRFVEFSLDTVHQALSEFLARLRPRRLTATERIAKAKAHFGRKPFSRAEYIRLFGAMSTATASRDLATAVRERFASREGDKATARYRFVRKR
jgi:Fic family protein